MGQKVNPHGLRVGIIKGWDAQWYADKKNFSANLIEDQKIRNFIKKTYFTSGISKITIERILSSAADIVMVNTPYGGYPLLYQKYMQTLAQLLLPYYDLKPSMPSIGGGVHPGMVEKYIREAGRDIVLAAGGAVQGHPGGAGAGARAMRQAIDIVMSGQDFEEAARNEEELSAALKLWKYQKD